MERGSLPNDRSTTRGFLVGFKFEAVASHCHKVDTWLVRRDIGISLPPREFSGTGAELEPSPPPEMPADQQLRSALAASCHMLFLFFGPVV